jgi:transcriptional antiterminator RfaH
MTLQWYVMRSKPNKEEALWRQLEARGYQAFYPRLRVKPVNPRSRKIKPYFPGYLFVQVVLEEAGQSSLSSIPFSQGLVSFGGQPAEVPEGLVQAIRKRVEEIDAAGGEQLVGIQRGETVLIQDGPFAGYQAVFDAQVAGNERVRVLLKLLKAQQMKLDLPAGYIRRTTPR